MSALRQDLHATAGKLLRLSFDEGGRPDAERIEAILTALRNRPPRNHRGLLKVFLRLLRRELRRHEAVVEHAGAIEASVLAAIAESLSGRYKRAISTVARPNPALVAGVRVSIGDDVYDASVQGRLRRLAGDSALSLA